MISVKLAVHIDDAEAHRPLDKPTASWDAYDYFLRGNHMIKHLLSGEPVEELYKARKLLERSIELDSRSLVRTPFSLGATLSPGSILSTRNTKARRPCGRCLNSLGRQSNSARTNRLDTEF